MTTNIYAGAARGKVFVSAGDNLIALTPEGAEKLALELPRLAILARSMLNGEPLEVEVGSCRGRAEEINKKAGALVLGGCKWNQAMGAWLMADGKKITTGQPYPEATVVAYQIVFGEKP